MTHQSVIKFIARVNMLSTRDFTFGVKRELRETESGEYGI